MEPAGDVPFDKVAANSGCNDAPGKDNQGDDKIPDKIQYGAGMAFPKRQKIYLHNLRILKTGVEINLALRRGESLEGGGHIIFDL
jgi:hypothetical protein